jgi:hypothetical protein
VKAKLCTFFFVLICSASAYATPIVAISPSSTATSVGGTFTVDIAITGVDNLFGFQFDLGFDPSKLAGIETTNGDFISDDTAFVAGTVDNTGGTISFTANALIGPVLGVSGSGVLAHARFTALDASPSTPINLLGLILLDDQFIEIPFQSTGGTVTILANTEVTPVPEPATMFLVGSGLVAAWRQRRKRG